MRVPRAEPRWRTHARVFEVFRSLLPRPPPSSAPSSPSLSSSSSEVPLSPPPRTAQASPQVSARAKVSRVGSPIAGWPSCDSGFARCILPASCHPWFEFVALSRVLDSPLEGQRICRLRARGGEKKRATNNLPSCFPIPRGSGEGGPPEVRDAPEAEVGAALQRVFGPQGLQLLFGGPSPAGVSRIQRGGSP